MKSRQVRTRSRANDLSGRASSSRRVRFVSSSVVDCGSWVLRLVLSGEVSVPSATLVCSSRERSWLSPVHQEGSGDGGRHRSEPGWRLSTR